MTGIRQFSTAKTCRWSAKKNRQPEGLGASPQQEGGEKRLARRGRSRDKTSNRHLALRHLALHNRRLASHSRPPWNVLIHRKRLRRLLGSNRAGRIRSQCASHLLIAARARRPVRPRKTENGTVRLHRLLRAEIHTFILRRATNNSRARVQCRTHPRIKALTHLLRPEIQVSSKTSKALPQHRVAWLSALRPRL